MKTKEPKLHNEIRWLMVHQRSCNRDAETSERVATAREASAPQILGSAITRRVLGASYRHSAARTKKKTRPLSSKLVGESARRKALLLALAP